MQDTELDKVFRKLDTYLTDWCTEHDFDCSVHYGNDFEYDRATNTIYYAILVAEDHDKYYLPIAQKYRPELIECDTFILSFFHELGHAKTDRLFSDQEFDSYYAFLDLLPDELTEWDYLKYYFHPIEVSATEWSLDYIMNNVEEIEKFSDCVRNLVIEIFDELKIDY